MVQAQRMREDTELAFKRFILKESRYFEHEPQADLFRVNLLGHMLDRYDELKAMGSGDEAAFNRVMREYFDIPAQMRELGFEEIDPEDEVGSSRWPVINEDEAADYLKESSAQVKKRARGIAMCVGCMIPFMVLGGLSEWVNYSLTDALMITAMLGMLAMIAMGVYTIVTAKKPKADQTVRSGHFSIRSSVRKKLVKLREAMEEKARRRKGKGIALLVSCVAPIFVGALLEEILPSVLSGAMPIFGLGGMFAMIAAGVYQLVVADGEKKSIKRLLDKA